MFLSFSRCGQRLEDQVKQLSASSQGDHETLRLVCDYLGGFMETWISQAHHIICNLMEEVKKINRIDDIVGEINRINSDIAEMKNNLTIDRKDIEAINQVNILQAEDYQKFKGDYRSAITSIEKFYDDYVSFKEQSKESFCEIETLKQSEPILKKKTLFKFSYDRNEYLWTREELLKEYRILKEDSKSALIKKKYEPRTPFRRPDRH